MTQERQCDLPQISIKGITAGKIDFTKILKEFSNIKARTKRHFIEAPMLNSIFNAPFFFSCARSWQELPTRAELFQFYS